jgi:hypothetical protein
VNSSNWCNSMSSLLTYLCLQLQTATNPVHTVAGDSNEGDFQLNVTSSSTQVNITTGVVNATITDTLFNENGRLAVYQVDHVLLPLKLFGTSPLTTPPSKPEKDDGFKCYCSGIFRCRSKQPSNGGNIGWSCGCCLVFPLAMIFGVGR